MINFRKILKIGVVFFLMAPICLRAQRKLSDLPPAHAAAIQNYLGQHLQLEFLAETRMDQGILRDMRKDFGGHLTPFYRAGDFNRDGLKDFAVVLVKKGPPSEDQGPGLAKTHRYRHEMSLVIFNGQKDGGYKMVFVEKTTAPLVSFINESSGKRKRLYFGVYQTDEHFFISPAGSSYRAQ